MSDIVIRKFKAFDKVPYELLALADPSVEIVNNYINKGDSIVALDDNTIIGICVMLKTRPMTMEIVNISVREKYQGRGIGKELINKALKLARKDNIKVVEIGTGNSSINQLALYQKCGFRIVGVDIDFFIKHYEEEIIENEIVCKDMIRLRLEIYG